VYSARVFLLSKKITSCLAILRILIPRTQTEGLKPTGARPVFDTNGLAFFPQIPDLLVGRFDFTALV
jgi:hypothetical protein